MCYLLWLASTIATGLLAIVFDVLPTCGSGVKQFDSCVIVDWRECCVNYGKISGGKYSFLGYAS